MKEMLKDRVYNKFKDDPRRTENGRGFAYIKACLLMPIKMLSIHKRYNNIEFLSTVAKCSIRTSYKQELA